MILLLLLCVIVRGEEDPHEAIKDNIEVLTRPVYFAIAHVWPIRNRGHFLRPFVFCFSRPSCSSCIQPRQQRTLVELWGHRDKP